MDDYLAQIQGAYQNFGNSIQNMLGEYQNSIGSALQNYQSNIGNYIQSYQDSLGSLLSPASPEDQTNAYYDILKQQAQLNNSWSAEQAQKQMDFQERMSNTAFQRQIADLKAAGLNPVLSARLGGASTPSGSSATADTSLVSSMANIMDKLIDYQQTSALASLASGYSGSSGYGSGSASSNLMNTVGSSPIDPNTAGSIASSFGLPSWIGKISAKFSNGLRGTPSNRSEANSMAYKVGQALNKVAPNTFDGGIFGLAKSGQLSSKVNNAISSAKSVGSAVLNKVKSWFSK